VLRCAADKIVVKRNGNSHFVFFSLRYDGDNGTVILRDAEIRHEMISCSDANT